jgi:hypothetical protein
MALAKTEAGRAALKERSPLLSARQKSTMILFNGVKSVNEVLTLVGGLGVTQADVDQMIANGFLAENSPASPASQASHVASTRAAPVGAVSAAIVPEAVPAPSGMTPNQQRFATAWPLATQLTASLGLRGFRLNLSVESASGFDDLLALFPKIEAAVGAEKAAALGRVLKG